MGFFALGFFLPPDPLGRAPTNVSYPFTRIWLGLAYFLPVAKGYLGPPDAAKL